MAENRYTVVATLGPATATAAAARALVEAGAAQLRLNTSHVAPGELEGWLDRLGPILDTTPLVLDLQGSKWRLGPMEPLPLTPGESVTLSLRAGGPSVVVPHPDFFRAARGSDGRVLLDDARLELALDDVRDESARAVVRRGGVLRGRKGITLPGATYRVEHLTDADASTVRTAAGVRGVRLAVSYVRDAAETERYRALLGRLPLAAKIERPTAVDQVAEIARHCDELWVCRGDLGAEMGLAAMAAAVRRVGASLAAIGRPVLMAGQVLEHMKHGPEPTRSEVCHLHDLVREGWAGVVLSDETAVGDHPVAAVRVAAMFNA